MKGEINMTEGVLGGLSLEAILTFGATLWGLVAVVRTQLFPEIQGNYVRFLALGLGVVLGFLAGLSGQLPEFWQSHGWWAWSLFGVFGAAFAVGADSRVNQLMTKSNVNVTVNDNSQLAETNTEEVKKTLPNP